jgi:hypothetical protein
MALAFSFANSIQNFLLPSWLQTPSHYLLVSQVLILFSEFGQDNVLLEKLDFYLVVHQICNL